MTSPYPIEKVNSVSYYRTFLQRIGATGDSVGCIQLLSTGSVVAGYVHLRRSLRPPELTDKDEVVMDLPADLLQALLTILRSYEPLQIRYFQAAATADPVAFLEHVP
jgi:hypothetical protein